MTARLTELCEELAGVCKAVGRRMQFMEVCGTHTTSAFRNGLHSLMPENLRLVSGPGCPVCVTAQRHIDAAIELAAKPGVILTTYGDMLRVPGRRRSLEALRAQGARIRVVQSARTALAAARDNPSEQVVFLAVGFETTAPATAAVLMEAERAVPGDATARSLGNFSVLMCHKLIVPAMKALLAAGDVPLDGFLCPGHVSVIIGADAYRPIVRDYGKPCVVAGFEPEQMLRGLLHLTRQVRDGQARLENVYAAVVDDGGNPAARALFDRVFVTADTPWRALGVIPRSGFELASAYERFDALQRFGVALGEDEDHPACRCGEVIQGRAQPAECPLFGEQCTPLSPIGPCMVSTEGTCAAWYKYRRPAGAR